MYTNDSVTSTNILAIVFSVITNQIYPGEHPRASSISLMKDRRGLNTAVMLWGDGEQTNVFSFTDFDLLFPVLAALPSVTHEYYIVVYLLIKFLFNTSFQLFHISLHVKI